MRVQIRVPDGGGTIREDVQHINVRSDGSLVLRYSFRKETIADEDYTGFEVSPA